MFITRQNIKLKYDVVIIGAGPAGLVFARRYQDIVGSNHRLLIIESGDESNSKNNAQNLSLYEASGDLNSDYFPLHNQRLFGGTSTVWNGYCSVLEERSFQQGEWPIKYAELSSFYPAAANILQLPDTAFKRPEVLIPKVPNLVYRPYYMSPPKRFNDLDTRSWLANNSNIDILTNSTVTDIVLANSSVSSVIISSSLKNDEFKKTISVSKVVLAAGGIQNARLLKRSISSETLPSIGRYFCEHPHVYRQLQLTLDFQEFNPIFDVDTKGVDPNKVVHAFALSSNFSCANKLLSSTIDLVNFDVQYENIAGKRCKVINANSTIRAEMSPVKSNAIEISNSRFDFLNQGVATVSFEFNRGEIERPIRALSEQLLRSGLGRLSLLPNEYEITGGGHMIGTTRMGEDPRTSVVNSDCQVHGINNLYVAGSSIYPASAAANPTLTIVALSLRLADHLASTIRTKLFQLS